jgi:hypothetical protein
MHQAMLESNDAKSTAHNGMATLTEKQKIVREITL